VTWHDRVDQYCVREMQQAESADDHCPLYVTVAMDAGHRGVRNSCDVLTAMHAGHRAVHNSGDVLMAVRLLALLSQFPF
jgi:hypothetical protein